MHLTDQQWCGFYQQLQRLLNAGLALADALQLLAEHGVDKRVRLLSSFLRQSLLRGLSLTQAVHLTHAFNQIDYQLIAVGELSGHLPDVLLILSVQHQRRFRLQQELKKALTYPLFILGLSMVVLTIMLTWLVPQFSHLFNTAGVALPWLTRVVMHLSDWALLGVGCSVILLVLLIVSVHLLSALRPDLLELFITHLPLAGLIWQLSVWLRFCQSLGLMLQAGVPLLQALPIAGRAIHSALGGSALYRVSSDLQQGMSLAQAFAKQGFFPPQLILLLRIGERTGSLDTVLLQQAESFEWQLTNLLAALTRWLEPILMLTVGIMVALIVIALYLPIFELGKVI